MITEFIDSYYNMIAGLAVIVGIVLTFNRPFETKDELNQQVFHPVTLEKFLILDLISGGGYSVYLIFKNWRWVSHKERKPMLILVRSIFAELTNFFLFQRIAALENKGYDWFQWIWPLLAAGFLASRTYFAFFIVSEDIAPNVWVAVGFFASTIFMTPVVLQLLKLNADNSDAIIRNSRWSWRTWTVFILFVPTFLVEIYLMLEAGR